MLVDTIKGLIKYPGILKAEKEKLLGLVNYLETMVDDFRLKDLMALDNKR